MDIGPRGVTALSFISRSELLKNRKSLTGQYLSQASAVFSAADATPGR